MPNLDVIAGLLLSAALLGYFLAGILLWRDRNAPGLWAFGMGWVFNALTVLFNWLACGHPPFGSMYHVLVAVSLGFLPAYLYLRRSQGLAWLGTSFAFTSLVPLIGPLFMERDMFWRRMPALQSPWFVPHVMAYLIAYALATVGFILALRVLRARRGAIVAVGIVQVENHPVHAARHDAELRAVVAAIGRQLALVDLLQDALRERLARGGPAEKVE